MCIQVHQPFNCAINNLLVQSYKMGAWGTFHWWEFGPYMHELTKDPLGVAYHMKGYGLPACTVSQ
jgi:N-glycosylase/DNA lyase